ncbi:MAG TPA: IS110 family transposase [Hyphomicrobiaceae bacterium]|jgi:transposase
MDVSYTRCCGLDIHKRTVVACLIVPGTDGQPDKQIRTFGTMTADLLALADWLAAAQCTHVAMESTGVFWQPIYNVLEDRFTLLLVNARHIKTVPGRKTDIRDCEWIADLLRHGLLRPSFVPDRPQRELRELTRYRTALADERAAEVNRLQKTLEGANIKLAAVATDSLGVSGRQMLEALVAGTTDAPTLAALAKGRLRAKLPQLEQALAGRVGPHQRFLLARQLAHIDFLDAQIVEVSAEIAERLRPFEAEVARLDTIPGVGQRTAEILLAELGADLQRFPSAKHLASWAGMCPGNRESAGKRYSGKTRKGNPYVRRALVEAAQAAGHTRIPTWQRSIGASHPAVARRRLRSQSAIAS